MPERHAGMDRLRAAHGPSARPAGNQQHVVRVLLQHAQPVRDCATAVFHTSDVVSGMSMPE